MTTAAVSGIVSILALLAAGDAGTPRHGPNLVHNPGFETRRPNSTLPADWTGDAAVYSTDAAGGRNGSAALKYVNADPQRYRLATQRLPLQPGRKYLYAGWVKTDGIQGDETGATLCLEWQTKEGKWLGGSYAHGIKGTRDWTLVTGIATLPDQAASCNLGCYVRRGMTGTAWFDDLEVVRLVDPPLHSMLVEPLYRGRITADGPAEIRLLAHVDLRDLPPASGSLTLSAALRRQPAGEVAARTQCPVPADVDRSRPLSLAMPAAGLAPGRYELQVSLDGPDSKPLHTERHQLDRPADDFRPRSTIDRHRRLLVEGRPFFPLGLYFSGIKEADLRTYAHSKFNCLMPYGSPDRKQLDLAHELGLKVIYSIKDWYAGSQWPPASIKSVADEEPAVRARVRQYRDHPALLAWYLNDELPQRFLPQLEAHQRWVAEEDPHHPTWVVLYQVNEVAAYLRTFDVIGTDPYPIGRKPASMAAQWTAETSRQVRHARPMWQVPQIFNWANYAKNDADRAKGRSPTLQEMRSMAWQCIAEGATGLIFYSWYDLHRNPDLPFDTAWEGLKRLAAEIDGLAPVILSVEPAPHVAVDGGQPPAWLHLLVRRHQGKLVLVAVNDGDGEGSVRFGLPPAVASARETTSGRTIPVQGGVLEDRIPRLAVQIYQMPLP